jgi:hypothetical protein
MRVIGCTVALLAAGRCVAVDGDVGPAAPRTGLTAEVSIRLQGETPAFDRYLVRGWHRPEADSAWTGRDREDATIRIPLAPGYGYDVLVLPQIVPAERFEPPYEIQVLVNGRAVKSLPAREASTMIEVAVPSWALAGDAAEVALRCPLFSPAERGESPDSRWLGIKVQRIEIVPWKKDEPIVTNGERAVGIFRDADVPRQGCPSDPDHLARLLRDAGIPAVMLSARDLSSVSALDPERLDLVVLPYGPAVPAAARKPWQRFLRRGGGFVSMGGYAFDHLYADAADTQSLGNAAFDDELAGWQRSGAAPGVEMSFDSAQGKTKNGCARVTVREEAPVTWYALTVELAPLPAGAFLGFAGQVKTDGVRDGAGAYAAVDFHREDGSRITWGQTEIKQGTTAWAQIRGQVVVPEGAHRATLSLLLHGRGTAWFDDLRAYTVPPPLNTRDGKHHDFLEVEPDQISVFDAGYPLEHAVLARAARGQTVFTEDMAIKGQLGGMAAVGMTGANWYCTTEEKCRYVPLLQAYDRFGRERGPAGGLMLNYAGLYRGSAWAFFGVDTMDLFSPGDAALGQGFVRLVKRLRDPLFLHETASDLTCYEPGETVELTTRVSNFGEKDRACTVRLLLRDLETDQVVFTEQREVVAPPGVAETVRWTWRPERFAGDLYQIEAVLLDGAEEIDRESTNGFVVWQDEVLKAAPRLSLRDNYLRIGDRPTFLTGTQQFWASRSYRTGSPLTIARDFRDMRDYGVRLSRSFMRWKVKESDREEQRFRDMMVYLAQRYGVVMYHEGTGAFPPASADLAEERKRARFLAERYGGLPLFLVDHQNEPALGLADTPQQNAWFKRFVERKYKEAPPYTKVTSGEISSAWGDLRSYDLKVAASEEMARWARVLSEEMRAVRPELITSVGFLQEVPPDRFSDPLRASGGLQLMNRHFYGPLGQFPAQFKEIDMRYRGVPPSNGEFGSKTHPTRGGNSESKEQQFTRYEFISHYALGLGGVFIANWTWRDSWESIFAYGIFRQDHVPKDIAKVYRGIGLLAASIQPTHRPPEVYVLLPDGHRLNYWPLNESLYRAIDEMMNQRVDFGVINEANLSELPSACKAILFPLPYSPAAETMGRLDAFVRRGGFLYVSGDLGYDAGDLQRRHARRLVELCGVEADEPGVAGLRDLGKAAVAIRPTGLLPGVRAYQGRNRLSLRLRGAKAAAVDDQGRPVAVVHDLGQGRVVFTADPLEVEEAVLAGSALYPAFLALAGVQGHEISPGESPLHCFEIPTRQGTAWVVYDRRPPAGHDLFHMGLPKPFRPEDTTSVTLKKADLSLALAPMKPGFAHLSSGGDLLAVEAQGRVSRKGVPVLETDTHAIVIALDGRDLRRSDHLLVMGYYPGSIRVTSDVRNLRAELGELREGRWVTLAEIALGRTPEAVALDLDEGTALEMVLLSTDPPQAARYLRGLAGFGDPVKPK